MSRLISPDFFDRDTRVVARELLGAVITLDDVVTEEEAQPFAENGSSMFSSNWNVGCRRVRLF